MMMLFDPHSTHAWPDDTRKAENNQLISHSAVVHYIRGREGDLRGNLFGYCNLIGWTSAESREGGLEVTRQFLVLR